MKEVSTFEKIKKDKQDANICIGLGAGVGIAGAASALIAGAVCPLCVFVAPGLIGVGAYKRWKANSKSAKEAPETKQ